KLAVEASERRAAIARHEACGVQTGGPVAIALREQQPHQRLQTGDEQGTRLEPIPVLQPCNLAQLDTLPDALLPYQRRGIMVHRAGAVSLSVAVNTRLAHYSLHTPGNLPRVRARLSLCG